MPLALRDHQPVRPHLYLVYVDDPTQRREHRDLDVHPAKTIGCQRREPGVSSGGRDSHLLHRDVQGLVCPEVTKQPRKLSPSFNVTKTPGRRVSSGSSV